MYQENLITNGKYDSVEVKISPKTWAWAWAEQEPLGL